MEEQIPFLAWNFEAHKAPTLSRDDWLMAFAAVHDGSKFHGSLPELSFVFLMGQINAVLVGDQRLLAAAGSSVGS